MKTELDSYLSKNFIDVKKYTIYLLNRLKLDVNYNAVISNAYISCIENENKFSYGNAQDFLFHFIKCELIYRKSNSKKELITSIEQTREIEQEIDYLESKINEEIEQQNCLTAIEIYRQNETDRIKLIFFETFYDKKFNTTRGIAKHFDISIFTSHKMITEMKFDIQNIKQKYELNHY